MCLCVDELESPAFIYAWTQSKSLTTAFSTQEDAERAIRRCGIGAYHDGSQVLWVRPHPDKRIRHLKPLPKFIT